MESWIALAGRLALALWSGGGAAVAFIASPAIFRLAPSRTVAGNQVGLMLRRFDFVTLGCLLVAAPLVTRGDGLLTALLAGMAVLALASQLVLGPMIRKLREQLGHIDEVPKDDPRRRRFGALHGVSVLLLLGQVALGALALLRV